MAEKSWGIRWNQGMQYASDLMCKCQGESLVLLERLKLIVGFDTGGPATQRSVFVAGIGIFRCSKCQELYWFHLDSDAVEFMKKHVEKWDPGD